MFVVSGECLLCVCVWLGGEDYMCVCVSFKTVCVIFLKQVFFMLID